MYAGIDIGGSKTLVASLDSNGVITQKSRFDTPASYDDFIVSLRRSVSSLDNRDFQAAGVAVPGRLDRRHGIARVFGNLPWRDVPIQADAEHILNCPVVAEHDASLAGLSESKLLPQFDKLLYLTVSTGIGGGLIVGGHIDPAFADSEPGQIRLEHGGRHCTWESFASGKAIVRRYGKRAEDIHDATTWRAISRNLAQGIIELIAVIQPDVIVIGGGVGTWFERYADSLNDELSRYQTPLVAIPPIRGAARPEEAVLFGCYDLARERFPASREAHHHLARTTA